jgi:hypothetical protein
MLHMKSPFKFLSPYEREDYDCFFGRKEETDLLYEFVNLNRVVLVYGQSGTGKTSLIQCGLSNYFQETDWIPFFIRRGNNINLSLYSVILEGDSSYGLKADLNNDEIFIESLGRRLEHLKASYLRPVYLIFDQFEELLILGTEKEREVFIRILQKILFGDGKLTCNIIIVMREEYFAWLDTFEKYVPGISDRRLRVENMRPAELRDVILRSTEYFNIRLENPEINIEQILQALSMRKDVSLPYLQVYLDQLWRKVYNKTYPDGYNGIEKYVPITFTTQEISEFGEIKDVLQQLIQERKDEISHGLKTAYSNIDNNFVQKVLDVFASEEGTKLPAPYIIENGKHKFRNPAKALNQLHSGALEYSLKELEKSSILRNDGHSFELAHDSLARLIDRQRDAKQKRLNGIRLVIENSCKVYEQTHELLPYELVKKYESNIGQLNLKEREKKFFEKSREAGRELEYGEWIKARNRKNMKIVTWALVLALILLLGTGTKLISDADSNYALVYAAYRLDSIPSKYEALQMGSFIHNYKNYDNETRKKLQDKILKMAIDPSVQKGFARYNYLLPTSRGLEPGDADLSGNGKYMIIRNLPPIGEYDPRKYYLLNTLSGHVIDTFSHISYAYFLHHSDTLMLARGDSTVPKTLLTPNEYLLYNCRISNVKKDFKKIPDNGLLYPKETIFNPVFSDHDNYKVCITKNGSLLFPVITNKDEGKLYVLENNNKIREHNSVFSVSHSVDRSQYMVADRINSDLVIEVFRENGSPTWEKENIYMADFTERGSIIYIDTNTLHLFTTNTQKNKSYPIKPGINYAIADGDESVALIRSNSDTIYLADLKSGGRFIPFPEKLVGFNFANRLFITKSPSGRSDKLYLRDFNGTALDSFLCAEGIRSQLYNPVTNQAILLTKIDSTSGAHYLIILDGHLKKKLFYALTPNDTYGMSADGSVFFYVRDNLLSVFKNDEKLVNLNDYNSVEGWLKKGKDAEYMSDTLKALRKNNKLRFPSQRFLFRY